MRTDQKIFIEILVLQEQTTTKKFHYKTWLQSSVKKKIKHLVFIYLVTQNNLYSKNLQQTYTIFWFYCKELLSRIPKHSSLHFSKFPTIFYGISKFTAKITNKSLEHYSSESRASQTAPWAFPNSNTGSLAGSEQGAVVWPAKTDDGDRRRRGWGWGKRRAGQGGPPGVLGASGEG